MLGAAEAARTGTYLSSAATVAQAPAQGCVLPIAEATPVAVTERVVPVEVVDGGFPILPAVLGAAALAALAYLVLKNDDDDDDAESEG
jgi:hypothetical protein